MMSIISLPYVFLRKIQSTSARAPKINRFLGVLALSALTPACLVEFDDGYGTDDIVYEEVVYDDGTYVETEVIYETEPLSFGWCDGELSDERGALSFSANMDGYQSDFYYDAQYCSGCVDTVMTLAYGNAPYHEVFSEIRLLDTPHPVYVGAHDLGFGFDEPSSLLDRFTVDIEAAQTSTIWEGMLFLDYLSSERMEGSFELILDDGWVQCHFDLGRNTALDRY